MGQTLSVMALARFYLESSFGWRMVVV